jgi:hypothetical protein
MLLSSTNLSPALRLLLKLAVTAVMLTGCGGGGSGSSSSPAKSSFSAGPITGFGSVIVNGTRFNVSNAHIADDEDEAHGENDLKLGMVAEIEGGDITVDSTGSHCNATDVHFRSVIIGPVDAIDTSTRLLVVLGQTIDVSDTTVFDARFPNGPFSISVGDVLQIFGTLDTNTGHYRATRIEPKPDATFFKLRGMVSNLDTGARTFMIGSETISFANLEHVPDFANGIIVTAKLQMNQVNGVWIATALRTGGRHLGEHDEAESKGRVTSIDSQTQFSVDGIPVDASSAIVSPQGATITLGSEVEVEGTTSNGMIIASKVTIENENDDAHQGFELHGAITMLDTNAQTFVLRGLPVSYAGAMFQNGSQSNLANGSQVEIKATLSSDGTGLVATTISFEH